jgi:hypothetical protein
VIVELIQFMRPNGRQVPSSCEVSDDLASNYRALREAGCRLTAEVLMTGVVSQAIEHSEGDFAIELCQNAPDKPREALENLLRRFNTADFEEWLKAQQELYYLKSKGLK